MERVSSMFSNAFASRAGQLVEKATSSNLSAEDWALNMEICDCVNSYDEGPKDAVKAIKRRLSNNKNTTQIGYTLTVLETCVKNCGGRFHILITSKEFCNDVLLKLIHPKNSPTLALQQKILGMIQEWAQTFKSTAAMNGVVTVYEELKEKGWEFPKPDKTAAAPIITPKRSVRGPPPASTQQQFFSPVPVAASGGVFPPQGNQPPRIPPGAQPSTGPIKPSADQISKLRSELQIVLGNVQVMSDMLMELVPAQTDASDLELLQELNRTCRAMQQRIVELVERVANEELTVELLKVNDDLNNVFLRYERFEKYRTSQAGPKTTSSSPLPAPVEAPRPAPYPPTPHEEPPPSYSDTEQPTPEVNDLIDLGNDDAAPVAAPTPAIAASGATAATNNLAALSLDQLMMTPSQPASYPTLSQDLAQFDTVSGNEPSLAEMNQTENEIEEWLKASGDDNLPATANPAPVQQDNGETTDEFNAFLSERAMAGEQLADVPSDPVGQTHNGDNRQRKMQTAGQPMFGL